MRGKTLVALLNDLRAECRMSLNPAHNAQVRDSQVMMLQRTQEWLWEDFNWPHLTVERQYAGSAGQRLYDFSTDFDMERIEKIEFKTGAIWHRLGVGIEARHYALFDSDLDQRGFPAQRWRVSENDETEIWPILDADGVADTKEGFFKVTGVKRLGPLVADADTADLDDRVIVLYAAAEMLGDKGGQIKLDLATKRYAKLKGHQTKNTRFQMFGVGRHEPRRRHVIGRYTPPES